MNELKEIDKEILTDFNSHYHKLLIPPEILTFLVKELEGNLSIKQKNFFILLKGFLHRADHFASSYLENEIEIDPFKPEEIENKVKEEIKKRGFRKV